MQWQFDHLAFNTPSGSPLHTLMSTLLGLEEGPRPAFPVAGRWLYQGKQALVHVIERKDHAKPALSHIAFRTDTDASKVLARVKASGLSHGISELPDKNLWQIFVQLPGSIMLELVVPANDDPSMHNDFHRLQAQIA